MPKTHLKLLSEVIDRPSEVGHVDVRQLVPVVQMLGVVGPPDVDADQGDGLVAQVPVPLFQASLD